MSSIFNALFRSAVSAPAPAPPSTTPAVVPAPTEATEADASPAAPSPIAQARSRQASQSPKASASQSPKASTVIRDAPFPPSPYTPGHSHISGEHAYDITSSTISEPTDILFPRGVPYIHRRQLHAQAEADGTPIKAPSFYQNSRDRSIAIRDPADVAPTKVEVKRPAPAPLTKWRKEQIRRQNQPRLIEPIVLKAIPALHGPPNLPYARNPSGVDSSIPDDSTAYLPYPNSHLHSAQAKAVQHLPELYAPQISYERQAAPPIPHAAPYHPSTRVPYQQYAETADLILGDGGLHKRVSSVPVPIVYASIPIKSEARLSPSEVLRAQMHHTPSTRPLESITEHAAHPVVPAPVLRPLYIDIARKVAPAQPAPAAVAAQKIVDDVDTYPTKPRYVAEPDPKLKHELPATPAKVMAEDEATAKALASSKADASVNWRLKTPAKGSGSRVTSFDKYPSSADRSDDAPTMTIDTLFEKFAPSSGSSPITIKVNTPPHSSDPAVKEISQTPLTKKSTQDPRLLRAPSPDLSMALPHLTPSPTRDVSLTSEAIVEDLLTLSSGDENSAPKRPARKGSKAKGTPGAGKHLKRAARKEMGEGGAAASPKVSKSPLGVAKTVSSSGKGNSPRIG